MMRKAQDGVNPCLEGVKGYGRGCWFIMNYAPVHHDDATKQIGLDYLPSETTITQLEADEVKLREILSI